MKTHLAVIVVIFLIVPVSAAAHHSFVAQFDSSKPGTVRGTLVKLEWTNPHSWLRVGAKDEGGKVKRWQCELASPNQLTRQGWSRDTVKVGDQLTIEGSLARNDPNTCHARIVKTADGKRVLGEGG